MPITGMRQAGWKAVHPAEEQDWVVTQLGPWPLGDHIHVPAGYELHISVEARPSAKLKRLRKKGLAK
jgi:hypothetical protein